MVPLCTAFCNDPYSVELVWGGHSAIPRGWMLNTDSTVATTIRKVFPTQAIPILLQYKLLPRREFSQNYALFPPHVS